MAYRNGISIVRHQTAMMETDGVYDVRLHGRTVAHLWNNPGDVTTGWRSTIWHIENYAAGIDLIYNGFNTARAALRDDPELLERLRAVP